MRAHVAKVHQLGMKYILWYSVPFVGKHSKAWSNFAGKTLEVIDRLGAGVLDPRFPEVREYIIATYERALRDWDLDGFKLDFVDSFGMAAVILLQRQVKRVSWSWLRRENGNAPAEQSCLSQVMPCPRS